MKIAGFQWDDGNWPKCARHGLSQAEVESVFLGAPAVHPNRIAGDGEVRQAAIGRTAAGRYAFVVFTLRTVDGAVMIRPISARYMHQREIEHYERQA